MRRRVSRLCAVVVGILVCGAEAYPEPAGVVACCDPLIEEWMEDLTSADRRPETAARWLAVLGEPSLADDLVKVSRGADAQTQRRVIAVLEWTDAAVGRTYLREVMVDPKHPLLLEASWALPTLGPREDARLAKRLLRSETEDLRQAGIGILTELQDPAGIDYLVDAVLRGQAEVGWEGLTLYRADQVCPRLIAGLPRAKSCTGAARVLRAFRCQAACGKLMTRLDGLTGIERRRVLRSLVEMRHAPAYAEATRIVHDEDIPLSDRAELAAVLAEAGQHGALVFLRKVLHAGNPAAVNDAVHGLGLAGDAESAERIACLWADGDAFPLVARTALIRLDAPGIVPSVARIYQAELEDGQDCDVSQLLASLEVLVTYQGRDAWPLVRQGYRLPGEWEGVALAARCMAPARDAKAWQILAMLLKQSSTWPRAKVAVLDAIGWGGSAELTAEVLRQLGDASGLRRPGRLEGLAGNPCVNEAAARALGRIAKGLSLKDRADLEDKLQSLIREQDSISCYGAALAVGYVKPSWAVQELKLLLANSSAALCRAGAAQSLGTLGDARGYGPLLKAADDSSPLVRYHATVALGRLGDGRGFDRLRQWALQSSPVRRRCAAIIALGELGDPRSIAVLAQALEGRLLVRHAAVKALAGIDHPRARAVLKRLESSADPFVANTVRTALIESR